MKCPVCRAAYRSGSANQACRRCGADLSALVQLHDRAIWHYRQAIQAFQAKDYETAIAQINQAIALQSSNADFHALAGQLWALQGELWQAIDAWKRARQLDPQQPIAQAGLRYLLDNLGGSDRSSLSKSSSLSS
jgi:tetratricopeptide (TPR) repeat protein